MDSNDRIEIRQYTEADEQAWDDFVFGQSVNGTFLQSRRFLNYHPKERFEDFSLMFYLKGRLVAVCPACVIIDNGLVFVSHQGSTYGGIVSSPELLRLEIAVDLLEELLFFLRQNGFNKVILKPTMSLLCKEKDDTIEYALSICGFSEHKELNLYIDYEKYEDDILSNLSKLKKRQVKKCINEGLELRELDLKSEISVFYSVLSENLLKFDRVPVHTINELIDLKQRLPNNVFFYGAYKEKEILSVTMVFEFPSVKCAHTQYLAARSVEGNLSPMSFIYYSMAKQYCEREYRYLSWGIATEHNGEAVNWGLMRNKEEFGSHHCTNRVYYKYL